MVIIARIAYFFYYGNNDSGTAPIIKRSARVTYFLFINMCISSNTFSLQI